MPNLTFPITGSFKVPADVWIDINVEPYKLTITAVEAEKQIRCQLKQAHPTEVVVSSTLHLPFEATADMRMKAIGDGPVTVSYTLEQYATSYNCIPVGGASGEFLKFKDNGEAQWSGIGQKDVDGLPEILSSKLDASALSSNLIFFMTDIVDAGTGYNELTSDMHDIDMEEPTAVESDAITNTQTGQNIGNYISNVFDRYIHVDSLNVTIAGEVRLAATVTANAAVRYEIAVLRASDNQEETIAESGWSSTITLAKFYTISMTCIIPHVELFAGDRLVVRYFAKKEGIGSNPKIRYRIGGPDPMRLLMPLPVSAVLPELPKLEQVDVEDGDSDKFGLVSGERLKQAVNKFSSGAVIESASSLAVSNPNLFTARQSAALSKDGMSAAGINQIVVDGVPHWSTTGSIRVWGPFARESISGDTLSAAINITAFSAENDSGFPRVAVIQYSNPSMTINYEVARENVILTDFTPGFFRFEGVDIHPDCTHIGFFVGANGKNNGTITYRDMLLCSGSNSVFRTAPVVSVSGGSKEVWVSPSGSDGGSGSSSQPFATITRAAAELGGTGTIYLAAGDYGNQQINAYNVRDLKIVGGADSDFNRSMFRYGTQLSLSAVSGRTSVFSAPLTRTVSWLWVDGIADEQTLVPYNEQHSLLNGRAHRLECTKVWHIPADNLGDALDLIEMSATPVCWRDTSTNTVYLSLPDGADINSEVYGAFDDIGLFSNNRPIWTPEAHIELVGIDIRYGHINTKSFRTSSLTDVRVVGAGLDGFDIGNWAELSLCSAGGSGSGGGLGDGFNAHNHAIWTYKDCYGHDNWDDGESSHENCKATGWGNIMEYNGGSGFTPALGAQEILHNCLSRKNATSAFRTGNKKGGFQVASDPTETDPGIITSMEAYNCVSIGDRNGFYDGTASVAPSQRRLIAVNCRVFDAEETAYACAEIRDCTQSGSATVKSTGTVVVNSSTVS
jgi:hypothetical protein